jgi:fibronectin type 3 domain-containing protein
VQGVHAVSDRPREVPLSWRPSADEVVVGYEIWRTEGDAGEWAQIGRVIGLRTTNYTDRGDARSAAGLGGLKDGQDYRYRIVAYNTANVRSSASQPDGARTKRCPQAPAEVKASTGMPRRVQIAWRANPEKDVSDYLVESSEQRADGFRKLGVVPAATGAPSVNETDLESGARRFYRVKANDADGLESEWSEVVEGRAKPLPDAPAGLKSEPARGGVRLTWDPPPQADVRKYGVWVRPF